MTVSLKKKTVVLISLGCAKNLVDSEVMLGILARAGYRLGTDQGKADILIVNTCGFIRPAKDEAEKVLRGAVRLKRKQPRLKIIVTGCYVERYRDRLAAAHPHVDAWLGVSEFDQIQRVVEGHGVLPAAEAFLYSHTSPRLLSTPSSWAYVKISEGCSHRCSFCAIPFIKGHYRSRPLASIMKEVQRLASSGVKEVNLVSQDSTAYGRDRGHEHGLVRLLEHLAGVRGLEWIRVLYGYPEEVSGALLEIMKGSKICRYLDLPFQHSAPKIVKAMRRSLPGDRALALIERIRGSLPQVALRTSLLVGFPGEGQKEFEHLKQFIRRARFDHLGVFTYSFEAGTPAQPWGDPVPEDVKLRRREELMALQREISRENNRRYLGQRVEVLLDRIAASNPCQALGRSRFQAPEVDGVIRVSSSSPLAGRLHTVQQVEIEGTGVYDLHGRLIE